MLRQSLKRQEALYDLSTGLGQKPHDVSFLAKAGTMTDFGHTRPVVRWTGDRLTVGILKIAGRWPTTWTT